MTAMQVNTKFNPKIILGIVAGLATVSVLILVVTGCFYNIPGKCLSLTQEKKISKLEVQLVTRPLTDLLPTKEDVGNEWNMEKPINPKNLNADYATANVKEESLKRVAQLPGVLDIIYQEFSISGEHKRTDVSILLYKFDSIDNATKLYQYGVDKLEKGKDIKKFPTSSIKATCSGGFVDMDIKGAVTIINCLKNNIGISVIAYDNYTLPISSSKTAPAFAEIIAEKI